MRPIRDKRMIGRIAAKPKTVIAFRSVAIRLDFGPLV
jgi:hypothetical protein